MIIQNMALYCFSVSCKWCGLKQTNRKSRTYFTEEWFGTTHSCSRAKGTCLGNHWRGLGAAALKLQALKIYICIFMVFMDGYWAGERKGCLSSAHLVFSPLFSECYCQIRRSADVFILE